MPTHDAASAPPPAQPRIDPAGPRPRKPAWLKVKVPTGERYQWIKARAQTLRLATVCEEARCPNIAECWQSGTATFMLMGDVCTRGCRFCSVSTARRPGALDAREPAHIAETIRELALDYVVLTMVNRDDLPDQGAAHVAETIRRAQLACPELLIEVLIGDFQGDLALVQRVIDAGPAVLAHNLETVSRLQSIVRDPRAGYAQSLSVLAGIKAAAPKLRTKSSLMLGLGETPDEVLQAMGDLRRVGVDFLTLGQYLQPDRRKLQVLEFITPERFAELEAAGLELGFRYVAAGPLVRSSYKAAEFFIAQDLRGEETLPGNAAGRAPRPR